MDSLLSHPLSSPSSAFSTDRSKSTVPTVSTEALLSLSPPRPLSTDESASTLSFMHTVLLSPSSDKQLSSIKSCFLSSFSCDSSSSFDWSWRPSINSAKAEGSAVSRLFTLVWVSVWMLTETFFESSNPLSFSKSPTSRAISVGSAVSLLLS